MVILGSNQPKVYGVEIRTCSTGPNFPNASSKSAVLHEYARFLRYNRGVSANRSSMDSPGGADSAWSSGVAAGPEEPGTALGEVVVSAVSIAVDAIRRLIHSRSETASSFVSAGTTAGDASSMGVSKSARCLDFDLDLDVDEEGS